MQKLLSLVGDTDHLFKQPLKFPPSLLGFCSPQSIHFKLYKDYTGPLSPSVFKLISTGSLLPSVDHIQGLHLVGFKSLRRFWFIPPQKQNDNSSTLQDTSVAVNECEDDVLSSVGRRERLMSDSETLIPTLSLYYCCIDLEDGHILYMIHQCCNNLIRSENVSHPSDDIPVVPSTRWRKIAVDQSLRGCMKKFWNLFYSSTIELQHQARNCLATSSSRDSLGFPLSDEEFFGLSSPSLWITVKSEYFCIQTRQLLQCGYDIAVNKAQNLNTADGSPSMSSAPSIRDLKPSIGTQQQPEKPLSLESGIIDVRKLSRAHRARM